MKYCAKCFLKESEDNNRFAMLFTVAPLKKLALAIFSNFNAEKIENVQMKDFDISHIFAQNIDCGYTLESPYRRGGSNEYPQSMFCSKDKKKGIPCKPPVLLYGSGL